ncbi:MAG: U32 family peptidase, partial [Prevotellaceae bacterium]|nr:U32 family peptidase [Prevotellaceae bacterium]
FSFDDLQTIVDKCRERHVKSYLTVNTIIYDSDLPLMRRTVDIAKSSGVSAIIASDVATMIYAVQQGVEVHLSTQLNISNVEALRFYAQFADVVVLARELTMSQVAEIHRAIVEEPVLGYSGKPVRIEMFCHGALCMAVSGKCYLSLHEYNASANRGACNQICRRSYTVKDTVSDMELELDNACIMSPKDLKTVHFLNKMIDAGVRVFKIEGRARGAEYVHTVVSCYREAIDSYLAGAFTEEKIAAWDARLARVFNRGFWNGYYLGQRLGEWTSAYGSQATHRKVYVGKCTNFFGRIGVAEFVVEAHSLRLGDEILVIGATTGVYEDTVKELRVDMGVADVVEKGAVFSLKTTVPLHRNDKLYVLVSNFP